MMGKRGNGLNQNFVVSLNDNDMHFFLWIVQLFQCSLRHFLIDTKCVCIKIFLCRHILCQLNLFADCVDQDQTAQNVQSDLDLHNPQTDTSLRRNSASKVKKIHTCI